MLSDSQFEDLISSTIEETKDIPEVISETGKIGMPHKGNMLPPRLLNLLKWIGTAFPHRNNATNWSIVPSSNKYQFRWVGSRFSSKDMHASALPL